MADQTEQQKLVAQLQVQLQILQQQQAQQRAIDLQQRQQQQQQQRQEQQPLQPPAWLPRSSADAGRSRVDSSVDTSSEWRTSFDDGKPERQQQQQQQLQHQLAPLQLMQLQQQQQQLHLQQQHLAYHHQQQQQQMLGQALSMPQFGALPPVPMSLQQFFPSAAWPQQLQQPPLPPPPQQPPAPPLPAAVAAPPTASARRTKVVGYSCHHCKVSREKDILYFCTNTARQGHRKMCKKKFCKGCMQRIHSKLTPSADQLSTWLCPSCQDMCMCSNCIAFREDTAAGMFKHQQVNANTVAQAATTTPQAATASPSKSDASPPAAAAGSVVTPSASMSDVVSKQESIGVAAASSGLTPLMHSYNLHSSSRGRVHSPRGTWDGIPPTASPSTAGVSTAASPLQRWPIAAAGAAAAAVAAGAASPSTGSSALSPPQYAASPLSTSGSLDLASSMSPLFAYYRNSRSASITSQNGSSSVLQSASVSGLHSAHSSQASSLASTPQISPSVGAFNNRKRSRQNTVAIPTGSAASASSTSVPGGASARGGHANASSSAAAGGSGAMPDQAFSADAQLQHYFLMQQQQQSAELASLMSGGLQLDAATAAMAAVHHQQQQQQQQLVASRQQAHLQALNLLHQIQEQQAVAAEIQHQYMQQQQQQQQQLQQLQQQQQQQQNHSSHPHAPSLGRAYTSPAELAIAPELVPSAAAGVGVGAGTSPLAHRPSSAVISPVNVSPLTAPLISPTSPRMSGHGSSAAALGSGLSLRYKPTSTGHTAAAASSSSHHHPHSHYRGNLQVNSRVGAVRQQSGGEGVRRSSGGGERRRASVPLPRSSSHRAATGSSGQASHSTSLDSDDELVEGSIVEERDSALANEAADDELVERSSNSLSDLSAVASPVGSDVMPLLEPSFPPVATTSNHDPQQNSVAAAAAAEAQAAPLSSAAMLLSPPLHSLAQPDWASMPHHSHHSHPGGGGGGIGGIGGSNMLLRTNSSSSSSSHLDNHFASHLQSPPRINLLYSHSPELMGTSAGAGPFDEISPSDLLRDSNPSSLHRGASGTAASAAAAAGSSGGGIGGGFDDRSSSPDLPVHKRSRGSIAPSSAPVPSRSLHAAAVASHRALQHGGAQQGSRSTSDGHWPAMDVDEEQEE